MTDWYADDSFWETWECVFDANSMLTIPHQPFSHIPMNEAGYRSREVHRYGCFRENGCWLIFCLGSRSEATS